MELKLYDTKTKIIHENEISEQSARWAFWRYVIIGLKSGTNSVLYDYNLPKLIHSFEHCLTDKQIIENDDITRFNDIDVNDDNIIHMIKKNGCICLHTIQQYPLQMFNYLDIVCESGNMNIGRISKGAKYRTI